MGELSSQGGEADVVHPAVPAVRTCAARREWSLIPLGYSLLSVLSSNSQNGENADCGDDEPDSDNGCNYVRLN
jgi:hypothetical protein